MPSSLPLHQLASMTASGPRFALNSVSVDSSGRLEILIPAPPSQWRFRYEGLTYAVALEPGEATSAVKIQARVGTVPYTAENPGTRLAALTVLKQLGRESCRERVGQYV